MKNHRAAFALLVIAFVMFAANIGGYDLWPADEPRYAQVAQEMIESGDYLTPTVNGQRYQEKPPLLFWAIAAASAPFGSVTESTARIPSVLSAFVVLLFTYLLALRLFDKRVALWAMVVLATCARFWWQSRTAQIDMMLTACLMTALYAFWRWQEDRRGSWLLCFYGAIAAAILAKGPPGYLFPLFFVITFFWGHAKDRRSAHFVLGSIAVWAIFFAWYAPAHMMQPAAETTTNINAWQNVLRNTLGRLAGASKFDPNPLSYILSLAADFLPWTLFAPWALPWMWRRRKEGKAMALLLSWIVPAFIFFSLIPSKRDIYLLPILPPLAMLIAASIADLMDSDRATWRKRTTFAWAIILCILAIAPLSLLVIDTPIAWNSNMLMFCLIASAFTADTVTRAIKTDGRGLPIAMASHFSGLALFTALFIFPIVNEVKGAKAFCAPVREAVASGHDIRVYSIKFSREEYIFYSHHPHEAILTNSVTAKEIETDDRMASDKEQWKLVKALKEGTKRVPIASFHSLAESDVTALQEALGEATKNGPLSTPRAQAYQDAVIEELAHFDEVFSSDGPAFAYVETEHWRWIVPLRPDLTAHTVLRQDNVGSRKVLLIANAEAAAL